MNIHEAAGLMARIVDTWPTGRWPQSTVSEWTKDLMKLDVEVAEKCRQALKRGHATQPSYGQYLATYRALQPSPDWQPPLEHEPLASPAQGLQHIATIRAGLAERGHKT